MREESASESPAEAGKGRDDVFHRKAGGTLFFNRKNSVANFPNPRENHKIISDLLFPVPMDTLHASTNNVLPIF